MKPQNTSLRILSLYLDLFNMIQRTLARFGRAYRRWILRRQGAKIASDLQSFANFIEGVPNNLTIGSATHISKGSILMLGSGPKGYGKLTIGMSVFINHYTIIDCHHQIEIGDNVLIGPHVYICDFDHETATNGSSAIGSTMNCKPVQIASNVWIGAHAVILKGVIIGEGAVIASGAVVRQDIPPMTIAAGVPARIVKRRERTSQDTRAFDSSI